MSSEDNPRSIILCSIMLLLYATNISAAVRSKHITTSTSCQAFRRPVAPSYFSPDAISKSNRRSRAAFVALENFHRRGRKQQPTRYGPHEKHIRIRQTCTQTQLKSTHTSSHQQNENINSKQKSRQFYNNNNNPSLLILQSRINDLTSHPAVVWDESSTFASMQKKKLSRRHLHLFDRRNDSNDTSVVGGDDDNNNNRSNGIAYRDDLFDQFATAVCNAGVVARKEV